MVTVLPDDPRAESTDIYEDPRDALDALDDILVLDADTAYNPMVTVTSIRSGIATRRSIPYAKLETYLDVMDSRQGDVYQLTVGRRLPVSGMEPGDGESFESVEDKTPLEVARENVREERRRRVEAERELAMLREMIRKQQLTTGEDDG